MPYGGCPGVERRARDEASNDIATGHRQLFLAGSAFAATGAEIQLDDGSVIRGEIVTVRDSVYTIRSDSIGTVTVAASKIQNIRISKPSATERDVKEQTRIPDAKEAEILKLKERMTGDKAVMPKIISLQADPDFQVGLKDPEIMKAVDEIIKRSAR
jgi:hypothetical protein